MAIEASVTINGSKEEVWRVITEIENSSRTITGIEKIEVLDKPATGLVGLKWRETRTLYGKQATEVMWITDAQEYEYYKTRAESHGAVYISRLALSGDGHQTQLTMEFDVLPQTFSAKVMSAIMGRFVNNATKTALEQDLKDIKAAVEQGN